MTQPQTCIFILGCGVMQLPALRIAREMGWRIAAADANAEAPGRGLCDEFFEVDLKDPEGLIHAARTAAGGRGPDGVFTAGTDFSESAARVAEALGLPGHSVEAARCATDKVLMRRKFRERGVPSPDFALACPGEGAEEILRRLPGPWVVKPVDSMGARGVLRVDAAAALGGALAAAREHSRSGRALIETYMEGPEFSLDALVEDGRIIRCGLADRIIAYPPHFVELGHTIPSSAPPETAELLWQTFEKGIAALGLTRGAAKGDLKLTPSGPMVGEIAARLSGGYMSGWTWPHAAGTQSTRGGLRLAAGLDAGDCSPTRSLICAERALVGIDGTIGRLEGREAAMTLPGLRDVFLRFAPGDPVSFPRNNVEKIANVIAVGNTEAEAGDRAAAALRAIEFELDPSDPRTGIYLDARDPFPPDWFPAGAYFNQLWQTHPPLPSRRRHRSSRPRHGARSPEITLPQDLPAAPDIAGRTMRGILENLASEGRISLHAGPHPDSSQFASDFWKALVRGGPAGLGWYLDD